MKHLAVICGAILIFACGVSAQVNPNAASPVLLASSSPGSAAAGPAALLSLAPMPEPDPDPPQGVYGVFPSYHWQAYAGYTFLRFYEIPNAAGNTNGFNFSVDYYAKDWVAVDGELTATFGSQGGVGTSLVSEMGGMRFRWTMPGGLAIWVHGLAGASHFSPQTPFVGEDAFGYEAGGGVDASPHHKRLGYRLQADMVGTHYFGAYQYSPKISVGVVYQF
jgi:hypothetical protein